MNKAEHRAAKEQLARNRAVKGWAFRDLGVEQADEIRSFLNGGPCPELYRKAYALNREQLKLGPKDWYEAFADAVHALGKTWPDQITKSENEWCAAAADTIASRPEAEK